MGEYARVSGVSVRDSALQKVDKGEEIRRDEALGAQLARATGDAQAEVERRCPWREAPNDYVGVYLENAEAL